MTQEALAQQAYCAVDTIKKIEQGLRRPSRQLAEQFAECLSLIGHERTAFLAKIPADVSPRTSKNVEFVDKVAEANVRLVMQQVRERSPILREMLDKGEIGLVGGIYDLSTGEIHFFEK